MTLIQSQISHKGGFWSHQAQSSVSFASPSLPYSNGHEKQSSSGSKISPAVLFIIVILAVIFFISGLLHLLVRFLMKQRSSSSVSESYPELSGSDPFQRQLQQLFHLHDSGLDQAFIDALPVFPYKEIIMGSKEPFDCAVCLCEFTEKDKLRLLPTCSHAFHIDCIDTWLLSNSTCPLCRGNLLTPGIAFENPIFCFEDQREEDEFSSNAGSGSSIGQKTAENHEIVNSKRVFSVRLGKYRSSDSGVVEGGEGETSSSSKLDVRRCYSMGSYQYVVADSDLQVTLCPGRGGGGGGGGGVRGGGSAATNSVKLVKGRNGQSVQSGNASVVGDVEEKKINIRSKGDSFSVSKIWQWSRKGKFPNSSETHMGSSSVTVDLPWNDHKTLGT